MPRQKAIPTAGIASLFPDEDSIQLPPSMAADLVNLAASFVKANGTPAASALFTDRYADGTLFYDTLIRFPASVVSNDPEISVDHTLQCWECAILLADEVRRWIQTHAPLHPDDPEAAPFAAALCRAAEQFRPLAVSVTSKLRLRHMPPAGIAVLEKILEQIKQNLPTRCANVLERQKVTVHNILNFSDDYLYGSRGLPRAGLKSVASLKEALANFPNIIKEVYELTPQQLHIRSCATRFPYLTPDEVRAAGALHNALGHYPVFRMATEYFRHSADRQDRIYDMVSGISAPVSSVRETAAQFTVSSERIRQIYTAYTLSGALAELFKEFSPKAYPFLRREVIDAEETAAKISNSEWPVTSGKKHKPALSPQGFAALVKLAGTHTVIETAGRTFLIDKESAALCNFRSIVDAIAHDAALRHLYDIPAALDVYMPPESVVHLSHDDRARAIKVIADMLAKIPDVSFDTATGTLTLHATRIDVEKAYLEILTEAGHPMKFRQIHEELLRRHPKLSYTVGTLKGILIKSPLFKPMGKTSVWTLSQWDVCSLSIRALVIRALEESPVPLTLRQLMDYVQSNGRTTDTCDILTNITGVDRTPFLKFGKALYGLRAKDYGPDFTGMEFDAIPRRTFESNITALTEFIDSNGRFPLPSAHLPDEGYLVRWMNNIERGRIHITPEQKKTFDRELAARASLRLAGKELSFSRRCRDLSQALAQYGHIPTLNEDRKLNAWWHQALRSEKEGRLTPFQLRCLTDLRALITAPQPPSTPAGTPSLFPDL